MEPPGSAEQVLSWWKKGAISFQCVLAFIKVAKENKMQHHCWPEVFRSGAQP